MDSSGPESIRGRTNKCGAHRAPLQSRSTTTPGSQRTVRLIGRQQTLQSSISDCSDCEVSICNGKTSPQCGQVTSVSTINCIYCSGVCVSVTSSGVETSLDISENCKRLNSFVSRLSHRYPRGPTVHLARPTRSIPRLRSE